MGLTVRNPCFINDNTSGNTQNEKFFNGASISYGLADMEEMKHWDVIETMSR
jgi:hypothetical protein